ncbi:MAG: hypothetical protein Q7S92_05495 [Candidatus Diapherotrites archaeon]|nr:hypothetical protein [Candidatus Diapherotrites archaeon]
MFNSKKVTSANLNINWTQEQKKAIQIADQELEKHFPNKKNFGIEYKVTNAIGHSSPSNTLNKLYTVMYDLPNGPTDQSVSILADITAEKVIRFERYGA